MSHDRDLPDDPLTAELAEELASALRPAELKASTRSRLRDRVMSQVRAQRPGTMMIRAADEWVECAPKLQMKVLRRDAQAKRQTLLLRMEPGGFMPGHRHTADEELIVLEGECHIGPHRLVAGDVHLASAGSWHDQITTQTGVLVLLNGEFPPPL
jgi:quercetin dioxygenase-like cupin family protein